ncbi:hypothetical protein EDB87DRAFT_544978 [Lactarius vividus]|nr:hypothetical protein EDB87DRAFT_544978 [Lactarius vividus]
MCRVTYAYPSYFLFEGSCSSTRRTWRYSLAVLLTQICSCRARCLCAPPSRVGSVTRCVITNNGEQSKKIEAMKGVAFGACIKLCKDRIKAFHAREGTGPFLWEECSPFTHLMLLQNSIASCMSSPEMTKGQMYIEEDHMCTPERLRHVHTRRASRDSGDHQLPYGKVANQSCRNNRVISNRKGLRPMKKRPAMCTLKANAKRVDPESLEAGIEGRPRPDG